VKVEEGSEIYNFPIHHFEHFYSKFWSFSFSNSVNWISSSSRRDVATAGTPGAPTRAPGCVAPPPSASEPLARLPRLSAFPRQARTPGRRGNPRPPRVKPRYAHPQCPARAARAVVRRYCRGQHLGALRHHAGAADRL
jgi:hypothetical protein